jgi:Uma2 family endonuclease
MIVEKPRHTYAEYARLPEGASYQLLDGDLVPMPSPSPYHQALSMNLAMALIAFVRHHQLGQLLAAPMDVYLSETDTVQPDLLYIAAPRLGIIGASRIEGPPDLVVEILSPATAYYDLRYKKRLYERTGVQEYWIVDPEERSIEVYTLQHGRYVLYDRRETGETLTSPLLPGFSVDLGQVFG